MLVMTPARARTQTVQSGVQHASRFATTSPSHPHTQLPNDTGTRILGLDADLRRLSTTAIVDFEKLALSQHTLKSKHSKCLLFKIHYGGLFMYIQRIQVERLTATVVAFVVTVELIALRGKMTDVARQE